MKPNYLPLAVTAYTFASGPFPTSLNPTTVRGIEPSGTANLDASGNILDRKDWRPLSKIKVGKDDVVYAIGSVEELTLAWRKALQGDDPVGILEERDATPIRAFLERVSVLSTLTETPLSDLIILKDEARALLKKLDA